MAKRQSGVNNHNQKVVIFTVYRDTAVYLFEQLKARGFKKLAFVSGTGSADSTHTQSMEVILERFAPYTKLFREKEWEFIPETTDPLSLEAFQQWQIWIEKNHPETHQKLLQPIDLLIATDALSEGQNLQDADMVINYDIHWNPVRIIQRMGRIDRLGSPNQEIFGVNFWPSNNINTYLNLQGRIEERMATMKLAGAEVDPHFSDTFNEIAHDEAFERRMNEQMLRQMATTWDDIETNDQNLGFDNLSLERYRQDLFAEFNQDRAKYQQMPKGIYSGFMADKTTGLQDGMVALLGYPSRPPKQPNYQYHQFYLIYIDQDGQSILKNQKEVLDFLISHKDQMRYVPPQVDAGDTQALDGLIEILKSWLNHESKEEPKNFLNRIKKGHKPAIEASKKGAKLGQKFQTDQFDLIAWLLITMS